MEVVIFESAIASRANGAIVIALFDGSPQACVAIVKGSREAVRALRRALGSALKSDAK